MNVVTYRHTPRTLYSRSNFGSRGCSVALRLQPGETHGPPNKDERQTPSANQLWFSSSHGRAYQCATHQRTPPFIARATAARADRVPALPRSVMMRDSRAGVGSLMASSWPPTTIDVGVGITGDLTSTQLLKTPSIIANINVIGSSLASNTRRHTI